MNEMKETLGRRIVFHRKRLGMTQDQLAEHLGVTAQAVSKWENDQSCPDIAMLPRLAGLFEITTDELLGVAPPREEVVHTPEFVKPEEMEHHGRKQRTAFQMSSAQKGSLGFAVWVLLSGGLMLAANLLKWDVNPWEILWPCALLVLGVFGLFPRLSFFSLGCTLFGGYFLLSNLHFVTLPLGWDLVLPVLAILFGLNLLIDTLRKGRKPAFKLVYRADEEDGAEEEKPQGSREFTQDGTTFSCSNSFGESTCVITLQEVTAGQISASFGEMTVDLTQCGSIANGCRIHAGCSFGELTLLVPRSCRVETKTANSFGSIEFEGSPDPDAGTVIQLKGGASFGSIQVRYC